MLRVNDNPNFVLFDHVEIRKGTSPASTRKAATTPSLAVTCTTNGMQDRNEDKRHLLVGDFSGPAPMVD